MYIYSNGILFWDMMELYHGSPSPVGLSLNPLMQIFFFLFPILKSYWRDLLAAKFITQSQTSPWDAALGLSAFLELPFSSYMMYQTHHVHRVTLILAQDPSAPAFLNPVPDSFIHGIVHAHSFSSITFSDILNPNWQIQRTYHFFYKNTFIIDFSRVLVSL